MARDSGQVLVLAIKAGCVLLIFFLGYQVFHSNIPSLETKNSWETRTTDPVVYTPNLYLIPDEASLRNMTDLDHIQIFRRYANSLQVLCNLHQRVGDLKDGGKEVCADEKVVPRKPCLVYSFGSNNAFDFEVQVVKYYGCEVHTFDHTMERFGNKIKVPTGVQLHYKGLGAKNSGKLFTLDSLMEELGHTGRTLDILKMDIENGEWEAIPQMMKSNTLASVRQLLVEFHFYRNQNRVEKLLVFSDLYKYGFRTFSREKNVYGGIVHNPQLGYPIAYLVEMSFLNLKFIK